jgi:hypothetical protein
MSPAYDDRRHHRCGMPGNECRSVCCNTRVDFARIERQLRPHAIRFQAFGIEKCVLGKAGPSDGAGWRQNVARIAAPTAFDHMVSIESGPVAHHSDFVRNCEQHVALNIPDQFHGFGGFDAIDRDDLDPKTREQLGGAR